MLPSTRRGVLLFVSDRTERTLFSAPSDHVVTRNPESLLASGVPPEADWVLVDASVLDTRRPSWFDDVDGDVYVLAPRDASVPAWVRNEGLPTLDPAFVSLLDERGVDDTAGATMDGGVAATMRHHTDSSPAEHALGGDTTTPSDRTVDILSTVPFPLALLDDDGVIQFVNTAWTQFGTANGRQSAETDVGENYLDVCERSDDSFDNAAYEAIRRVLDDESDDEVLEYPCHGSGTERWYSMRVVSLADDVPGQAAVIHTDISQYRQHINVLDRVLRHNLRNKANIILGHAAALASERDDETATAATTIGAAARELLSLSEQARRYREVSTDGRPATTVDATLIVAEVTERMSKAHPHAVIETSIPGTALVRASQSLSLVVHELVENALVHNPRETPWVRVEVARVHERGGERVSIRVLDDGPGIPEEDQRLLTGGLDHSPLRHGSQLGVWVVNSLVTSLDGTVRVESRAPRGSIVTMTFPSSEIDD